MPGIFGLSSKESEKGFGKNLYRGTFYQQHFGEDFSGIAILNSQKELEGESKPGLFRENFEEKRYGFKGTEGIGYCGAAKEPLEIDTRIGKFFLCFSGNIQNKQNLKEKLKQQGVSFSQREGPHLDIEVIAKLIARGEDVVDGIKQMNRQIKGTFTLLLLTEEKLFGARSPDAHWPLIIGEGDYKVALASSSAGFKNLGFKIKRELQPGEVVSVKETLLKREAVLPERKVQICSFLWVYTDFPSGQVRGRPVSQARRRLGASLARKDLAQGFKPDIVIPIPDSGRFHAIGYIQEFIRQASNPPMYDEVLVKWPYVGRSYTPQDKEKRERVAHIKIIPIGETYEGKVIVLVDDSIVRGNQMRTRLVPKLRSLGVKEIHARIANPPLLSHCRWGKTVKKGEALASRIPLKEERVKILGVDSLVHNTEQDLVEAIGLPAEKLCMDCSQPLDEN